MEEPLPGTASRYRFWLLVEQPGPWGHDALVDSGLPRDVGRALRDTGNVLGIRVLLIKQRRQASPDRLAYLAYSGTRERRVRRIQVGEPGDLLDLDLGALMRSRFADVGEEVEGPLYLVCTHGKHDPCCATHGAPLARAVEERAGDAAWECTHVGGDRFAGNLLCLPHGLYYGRVPPAAAAAVVDAYERGEILPEHFRGRSAYSPPVQVAEDAVRRSTGLVGIDDLVVAAHERAADGAHEVDFEVADGRRFRVRVGVGTLEPRPLTCKATHPHRPRSFAVEAVEPVGR